MSGYVYRSDGIYKFEELGGDLDKTTGTLKELKEWVDELIKRHGESAKFEVLHPDEGTAHYRLERDATETEITAHKARELYAKQEKEARERAEYEKLRAKFEKL